MQVMIIAIRKFVNFINLVFLISNKLTYLTFSFKLCSLLDLVVDMIVFFVIFFTKWSFKNYILCIISAAVYGIKYNGFCQHICKTKDSDAVFAVVK